MLVGGEAARPSLSRSGKRKQPALLPLPGVHLGARVARPGLRGKRAARRIATNTRWSQLLSGWASINTQMPGPQEAENASTNRRDAAVVLAEYAAWLLEQPLSARTRETYLAAVRTFVAWLGERDGGVGEALSSPRGRDLAARDYKRHMKVDRGLSPASVNPALAGMDHLFRVLGLGAAISRFRACRDADLDELGSWSIGLAGREGVM